MKNILLMCSGGFSTSLLLEKMKTAAQEMGEEINIKAIATNRLQDVVGDYDCLLLAPQISFMTKDIEKDYPNIPIYNIQTMDYGRMNAKKILKQVFELIK